MLWLLMLGKDFVAIRLGISDDDWNARVDYCSPFSLAIYN